MGPTRREPDRLARAGRAAGFDWAHAISQAQRKPISITQHPMAAARAAPAAAAPDLHPEPNLAALQASLRVYGQRKPVVVNRRTGAIEAGNGTLQAALALGWSHLAAVYVDDDPMTAAGFSVADNRVAELAEWDRDALDKLLSEIKTDDPVLDRMLADLRGSTQRVKGRTDPDEVPAPSDEARTRPGDLWLLDDHRLLCGDLVLSVAIAAWLGERLQEFWIR